MTTTSTKPSMVKNINFWLFGFFSFFYFFIMAICFPWLPVWGVDHLHLSNTDIGLIFSCISLFAIIMQPLFGILSDKLGLKKHLVGSIVGALICMGPFFIYVFGPLLQWNIFIGALTGGLYIGFTFSAGCGVYEAYMEKASRHYNFEYGITRAFGNPGWGFCALIAASIFSRNPNYMFWMASIAALILGVLLFSVKNNTTAILDVPDQKNALSATDSKKNQTLELFKDKRFWMFIIFTMGVPCVYEVYDQQFATFFKTFFTSQEEGTRWFGYATTICEAGNAMVMFITPWILSKIGIKRTLIIAGLVMTIRVTGSAFATTATEVFLLKLLHAFELPLYIIGSMKYIITVFDVRLSATIYLIGFQFSKQIGNMILSAVTGRMYDTIGFHDTYLMLGSVVFMVTIISIFTLQGQSKNKMTASMA